jgi:hypothetical protein
MFRILPPLVLKVLVPALLTVVLVIAGAVVSQSQVRSIPALDQVPSLSVQHYERPQAPCADIILPQSYSQSEQEIINNLIIKDVVKIFKWMEIPSMTSTILAANIQGTNCDDDNCHLLISRYSFFKALPSSKYIGEIRIFTLPDKRKVRIVEIKLSFRFLNQFSPTKFIEKLSEGSEKPKEEFPDDRDCLRNPSESKCPDEIAYSVSIKNKYFKSSRFRKYFVLINSIIYHTDNKGQLTTIKLSVE